MALDVVSIVISVIALFVSGYIWYSDKKSIWYWNIVIVPMQETFKKMKKIDIKDKNGDKQGFHSFRKNASLRLQKVGVLPTFINNIIGCEGKSTMDQSYSNHRLPEIKEQVDKLNYDFLQPYFDKCEEIMKGV